MASNEELAKTIETLTVSIKSIQDDLLMLKCGAIHSGSNPQSSSGMQQSSTDVVASNNTPHGKKSRVDEEFATDDEEQVDCEDVQASLVSLSEAASAFLEAALGTKLENKTRVAKAKAHGTPDSRWIQCAKMDPVVMVNIPPAAKTPDRVASRLQQFWLDAANSLVFILVSYIKVLKWFQFYSS